MLVRLPRYQIGALQALAGDGRESVDAMLTRMFEELAGLNHERVARFIPGLAEAEAIRCAAAAEGVTKTPLKGLARLAWPAIACMRRRIG